MSKHGNSNKNNKPHHLYEIRDAVDDEVFKYGISHDPIDEDGYSNRMRVQVDFLNLGVKWLRFFARILLIGIPGKKEAKRIEKHYIRQYKEEHGHNPRGNKDD
jgi:URI fold toxin 2